MLAVREPVSVSARNLGLQHTDTPGEVTSGLRRAWLQAGDTRAGTGWCAHGHSLGHERAQAEAHTVTGWAHTPSSVSPALNMRTHERSALCSRRTSDGCPNTVPDRWLTSLCDGGEQGAVGLARAGQGGAGRMVRRGRRKGASSAATALVLQL